MDMFEDVGPIGDVGDVVERRQILQFCLGTIALTATVLIVVAVCLMLFTSLAFLKWPYFVILFVSLFVGVGGTLLAVRTESTAVFVPFLRVTPEGDCRIFRSEEKVDDKNFEYHIVLPESDGSEMVRYRGIGESHESIDVNGVRWQTPEQVEFDAQRMVELSRSVYIASVELN